MSEDKFWNMIWKLMLVVASIGVGRCLCAIDQGKANVPAAIGVALHAIAALFAWRKIK